MDYITEELCELYRKRRNLAEQISTEFGDGDFFESNEKYQALLRDIDEINEQINLNKNDNDR